MAVMKSNFQKDKQDALNKLTDAYEAVKQLVAYNVEDKLDSACEGLLLIRNTVRLTFDNEQE